MTTPAAPARYWAFISYSRHDKRVAHWLLEELRQVRVPASRRASVHPPATHLSSLYLDITSAPAGSNLSEELRAALRESHTLVVICSPIAVASVHVKEEIRYFQALGRADRIICVIAAGIPNSSDAGDPQHECFPEPLRLVPLSQRPLAAPVGQETPAERKQTALRVAAGIFGVTLGDLSGAQRRHTLILATAALCIVTALAGAWAAISLPIVTYARNIDTIYGVPRARNTVGASVAVQLPEVYRLERRGLFGKPTRLALVNGFGSCTAKGMEDPLGRTLENNCSATRACTREFSYNSAGEVVEERYLSSFGQVLERLKYTEPTVGLFTEAGFGCSRSKSGIRYITFDRYTSGPNAGMDRLIRYYGEDAHGARVPRSNDRGAFGQLYRYDQRGNTTEVWLLDADGHPHPGAQGWAGWKSIYDTQGEIRMMYGLDTTGQPTYSTSGIAGDRAEYDSLGRLVAVTKIDVSGRPTPDKESLTGWRIQFGNHGELLRDEYLDPTGKLSLDPNGIAQFVATYDTNGYETSRTRLDARGTAVDGVQCAKSLITRGPQGEVRAYRTIDAEGAPCAVEGDFERRQMFDERGNLSATLHFDGKEGPALWNGCHRATRGFDDEGRVILLRCYGVNGQPVPGMQGAFETRSHYDTNGNLDEQTSFAVDGTLVPDEDGVARLRWRYDDHGQRTWEGYFDAHDQPAFVGGSCAVSWSYDEYGRIAEFRRLGIGDVAVMSADGIAGIRYSYDSFGREIRRQFIDPNGGLVAGRGGSAGWESEYDRYSRVARVRYYDVNWRPASNAYGVAERRATFDPHGFRTSTLFFAVNGAPVANTEGIAGWNAKFDARGNETDRLYVELRGEPVALADGTYGWHTEYNQKGKQLLRYNLGRDGQPLVAAETGVAGTRRELDSLDRVVVERFVGARLEEVTNRKAGYSRRDTTYDAWSHVVSRRYFGPDAAPVQAFTGFAAEIQTWDDKGHRIRREFFDDHGAPAAHWVARMEFEFDHLGREVACRSYDTNGQLMLDPRSGRAVVETSYDSAGRVTTITSRDTSGHLIDRKDLGFAIQTVTYSSNGIELERRCRRASGAPVKSCQKEEG